MELIKKYTIALFGHRQILNCGEVRQKLYNYLKDRISGKVVRALVGTHGDFDRLALGVCKQLKNEGFDIDISLVYTIQKQLIKDMKLDEYIDYYKDVETMMYEIDNVYYKRKIIVSNYKMVDESDEVIIYYTGKPQLFNNKGTHYIMEYALKTSKPITNLYNNIN